MSSKERVLEFQVKILADRLAIALSRIEDNELDAFCEGLDAEFWNQEQGWLLQNDEVTNELRKRWRLTSGYRAAKIRIKVMLSQFIQEKRRAA